MTEPRPTGGYPEQRAERRPRSTPRQRTMRLVYLAASLYLFIFALMLMREGAAGLEPIVRRHLRVEGVANAVGFGWISAYAVLSGSPVAATALTLLDSGVLTTTETFAMIAGSRFGASFVVLLMGSLYAFRGHERRTSLSAGIVALIVTAVTQVLTLVLGVQALSRGWIQVVDFRGSATVVSVAEAVVGGAAARVGGLVVGLAGSGGVFLAGLAAILVSFALFDRALPPLRLEGTPLGRVSRLLYRPPVMFALGLAVTLVSMSVSVSVSLLVPLSARGYIRRENLIPYIMGANITTFVDTLIAAMLLANPAAFTVVLIEMVTTTLVSVTILALVLRRFQRGVLWAAAWVTASARNLAAFLAIIFAAPLLLLAV